MNWLFPKDQKNKSFVDYIYSTREVTGDRAMPTGRQVFFQPTVEDLSSPFEIHDAKKAAKEIIKAVKDKKKIYIHGDFDVDGITATSIMWNYLYRDLGANVLPHIPNRFTDGYGLNEETIEKIIAEGGNLIISVDCGVKDIELVDKYADQIDFIITDHHTIREARNSNEEAPKIKNKKKHLVASDFELQASKIPNGAKIVANYIISSRAKAVVHPKLDGRRQKTEGRFTEYCGAGVSWKLCCAINELNEKKVDMTKYLDLVALGTVCDIMPLVDENRTIVKLGLKRLQKTENIGLKSLLNVAKIDPKDVNEYHLGFVIGPRLNASGRLESALDAVRLLTTNSKDYANQLADKLDALNKQRQDLTKEYIQIAESSVDISKKIIFAYGKEWPEGIVGLIAGKLTEKYNRPSIVGSALPDGTLKASARSIEKFHISNSLKQLEDLLIRYGGHAQAAGLTMLFENIEQFEERINKLANEILIDDDLVKTLRIDAVANPEDINIESVKKLLLLSPFGEGNNLPRIALLNVDFSNYKTMGKDNSHVKIYLPEYNLEIVGFNIANELKALSSTHLDLAGTLDLNSWNGRVTPQFKISAWRIQE